MRQPPPGRGAYPCFRPITTRWSDNDLYGHVNNVRYYSFFDTAVNGWLIEAKLLDLGAGPTVFLVAETGCRFFAPLAFPQAIEAGLSVTRINASSVIYGIGIFAEGAPAAAAAGHFVHVHVDRDSRRPLPLPDRVRQALAALTPG